MPDGIVQIQPDSTGKKVDVSELTVGSNTVERQRLVLADDADALGLAHVTKANPNSTDYGVTVRDVNLPSPVNTVPDNTAPGVPIRLIGEDIWNCSFSNVQSSIDSAFFTQLASGTGVGCTQAASNLLITTGTTTNAEYLARSVPAWRGANILRYQFIASQRIANQNLMILLADNVGDDLAYTVNSATSVSINKTSHGYTAVNVGQFMFLGGITGAAGVPGRYAIASIPDANTINFTVAAWPASGTGTLHLFGHSHIKVLYSGVTATSVLFDAQRKGWASGDTTATTLTSVSPGHIAQIMSDGRNVFLGDSLAASTATPNTVTRASRMANLPDDNLDLFVYIWSYNGTVAPASTTTWTIGLTCVEKFANIPVFLAGNRMQGTQAPAPVNLVTAPTITITGTVTANQGTLVTPTPYALNSAATTNLTSIKASAGTLYGGMLTNVSAAAKYVKLYNKASAPVLASDIPIAVFVLAAGASVSVNYGAVGYRCALGIAMAITGGVADTDATAVALGDVKVSLSYI
jgi:hypothetical protein